MTKIRMFVVFLCVLYTSMTQASLSEIPNEFYLKERWFSWMTSFDIETDQSTLGSVHRSALSLTTQYDFYDANQQLQATAKSRFWTLGTIFDVTDAEGNSLGCVKECLLNLLPTFELVSPTGEVLATAKENFWETTYTIKDSASSLEIAQLSRSFFGLKSDWTVTIINPQLFHAKRIDPRLFIIVMAFQTDSDYWTRRNVQMQ